MKACSEAAFVRDKSSADYNMDKFLENLQNVNLSRYADHNFVNKYMEIYDNCFPYKKLKTI